MKTYKTYFNRIKKAVPALAAAALLMVNTSCERRDLWVYQDQFKQILMIIDWRNYDRDQQLYPHTPDPDGMTLWFFPTDGRKSYRYTTAEVNRYELYLSEGDYEGLVIDYSPAEYGHQEFVGMDYANTAEVKSIPSYYQPNKYPELYGPDAYGKTLPLKIDSTGFYAVAYEPEKMASDTIFFHVKSGEYSNYIPYKERNSYQSTLEKQQFYMYPVVVPWRMRVRVYIRGINYLYQTTGSIAGLANGFMLAENHTNDTPCLLALEDWQVYGDKANSAGIDGGLGYIAMTFNTWGMRNSLWAQYDKNVPLPPYQLTDVPKDELRLNLRFLLRDRATVLNYHFDVGDMVTVYQNEYVLRIDLMDGFDGQPVLPYVDAFNGMGFDGIVVPWEDTQETQISF